MSKRPGGCEVVVRRGEGDTEHDEENISNLSVHFIFRHILTLLSSPSSRKRKKEGFGRWTLDQMYSKRLCKYRKIENQKVGCAPHALVDHHHEDHENVANPSDEDDDAEDDRDQDWNNRLQPPENLLFVNEEIRGNVMRHFQRRPDLITDVVHVSRYF